MKLFTIGDSVSQGFMSLAAARTDNAYSTLIAKQLGLQLYSDEYRFADWNAVGIPLSIENIMRELQSRYGSNIGGLEGVLALRTINQIVDRAEDFYERGEGRADNPYDEKGTRFFNNVAVWGFDVADSFQIDVKTCKEAIYNKLKPTKDDAFKVNADYTDEQLQNLIIVARKDKNAAALTSSDAAFANLFEHLYTGEVNSAIEILTDDLAPVEYYNSYAQRAYRRKN